MSLCLHFPIYAFLCCVVASTAVPTEAADSLKLVTRLDESPAMGFEISEILRFDVSTSDLGIHHTSSNFGGMSPMTMPLDDYPLKLVYTLDQSGPDCNDPMGLRVSRLPSSLRATRAISDNSFVSLDLTLTTSGNLRVAVHDMRGRTVWSTADNSAVTGARTLTWGRTTSNGTLVAPGVYQLLVLLNDTPIAIESVVVK